MFDRDSEEKGKRKKETLQMEFRPIGIHINGGAFLEIRCFLTGRRNSRIGLHHQPTGFPSGQEDFGVFKRGINDYVSSGYIALENVLSHCVPARYYGCGLHRFGGVVF